MGKVILTPLGKSLARDVLSLLLKPMDAVMHAQPMTTVTETCPGVFPRLLLLGRGRGPGSTHAGEGPMLGKGPTTELHFQPALGNVIFYSEY